MNNLTDNIEYSLQQYAAITQAQLLNSNNHQHQQQQHLQDPNAAFNLAYTSFPLIRMAPPQLHQPTLAKELPSTSNTIIPSSVTTATPSSSLVVEHQNEVNERVGTPIRVTRPPNAYLLFNKEMRKILKDQDPTMKVAEISKEVGSRWKNMPKEQKDQYVNQANKLKEEQRALHPNSMYIRRSRAELVKAGHFAKRSAPHHASSSTTTEDDDNNQSSSMLDPFHPSQQQPTQQAPQQHKRKKSKRDKNPTIPKHPLSAYMWYLTEVRPETMRNFPGSNVGQISKLCADRWNNMSEEARLPWKSKAQVDKERYAREMQIYALQNDHILGRGTRQKYRSVATTTTTTATIRPDTHHESLMVDNVPLFYTDDKQHLYHHHHHHHQLSAPTSPSSILRNSLPMTLNPNALLQNHHSNDSSTDQYVNN